MKQHLHGLRSNSGSMINQASVSELLGIAYPRSVRMDVAPNGFKTTSLWPCDRNVIIEEGHEATVQTVLWMIRDELKGVS